MEQAGRPRGRSSRKPLSTQNNTLANYLTPVQGGEKTKPKVCTLGKKPAVKRDRTPDSSDVDDENVENKSVRYYHSPTSEDVEAYKDLARNLHRVGRINREKAVALNQQLVNVLKEEKRYLKDVKKKTESGKKTAPTPAQFQLDMCIFEGKRFQLTNKLNDLYDTEAKAVDHISPESTIDTTLDSDIFTEDDEARA